MQNKLVSQFEDYSRVLHKYKEYWQLRPFEWQQLPWQDEELRGRLNALSEQEIQLIDETPELQKTHFADLFPDLFALPSVAALASEHHYAPVPFWLSNAIGGRKLDQINAFIEHIPASELPVLEWCAGKGHLGRLLSFQQQREVTSVEWQPALCNQGAKLAETHQLQQRFEQADVMSAQGRALLAPGQQVVALHACGQLHLQLLQQAAASKSQQIHLAPCCYHLIDTDVYHPLSALAQRQDPVLSQQDLKLAVQGQVTGGARVQKLRHTEVWWRLSYQALYTEMTGKPAYRSLPSVAKHWFSGEFSDFARWAAGEHGIKLADSLDWSSYLAQGTRRLSVVNRIELVRHLFRRPLEIWLLLDRALFLQQHGYAVSLGTFCNYSTTPRNFLIQAVL